MGKRSREKMTELDEEGRLVRSQKQKREKKEAEKRAQDVPEPALLTTPFFVGMPKGPIRISRVRSPLQSASQPQQAEELDGKPERH